MSSSILNKRIIENINRDDTNNSEHSADSMKVTSIVDDNDTVPPGKKLQVTSTRTDGDINDGSTYSRLVPTESFSAISDDEEAEPSESISQSRISVEMDRTITNKGKKEWMKVGAKKEPRIGADFQVDL